MPVLYILYARFAFIQSGVLICADSKKKTSVQKKIESLNRS